MHIEFKTTYKKVPEKLISKMRDEFVQLSHLYKFISKVEVVLNSDESIISAENKICEIRLSGSGNDLFVHTRMENFESAATEALKELKKKAKQQAKKIKELPQEVTSTVKV